MLIRARSRIFTSLKLSLESTFRITTLHCVEHVYG